MRVVTFAPALCVSIARTNGAIFMKFGLAPTTDIILIVFMMGAVSGSGFLARMFSSFPAALPENALKARHSVAQMTPWDLGFPKPPCALKGNDFQGMPLPKGFTTRIAS
jgi:hypothetical protein